MNPDDLHHKVAELQHLLTTRLRVRGRDLDTLVRRAGRLLPRAVRREAKYLAQADSLSRNPKLARMIDLERAGAAHRLVSEYLATVDPAARARVRLLNWLALIALYFLIVGAAVIAVLRWRGIV